MGLLINGMWHDTWYGTNKTGGRFVARKASFANESPPMGLPDSLPSLDAITFT